MRVKGNPGVRAVSRCYLRVLKALSTKSFQSSFPHNRLDLTLSPRLSPLTTSPATPSLHTMLNDLLNVAPGSISDVPAEDLGELWTGEHVSHFRSTSHRFFPV